MAMRRTPKSTCTRTGLTLPECSCPRCLTELIRRFHPDLLAADPIGEIEITRESGARRRPGRTPPAR